MNLDQKEQFTLLKKYRTAVHKACMTPFVQNGHQFSMSDTATMLVQLDRLHGFAEKPEQAALHDTLHALQQAVSLLRKYELPTAKLDNLLTQLLEK